MEWTHQFYFATMTLEEVTFSMESRMRRILPGSGNHQVGFVQRALHSQPFSRRRPLAW